jgi:predicted transcriptional regulator
MTDANTKVLKVGIASKDFIKARTIAIARGERKRKAGDPQVWFTSMSSLAQILSEQNRLLLEIIRKAKPGTLSELAIISGRKTSNLSRTLRTMESYKLVRIERHDNKVRPVVEWDKVDIEVPIAVHSKQYLARVRA